jgi:hypothetical protein
MPPAALHHLAKAAPAWKNSTLSPGSTVLPGSAKVARSMVLDETPRAVDPLAVPVPQTLPTPGQVPEVDAMVVTFNPDVLDEAVVVVVALAEFDEHAANVTPTNANAAPAATTRRLMVLNLMPPSPIIGPFGPQNHHCHANRNREDKTPQLASEG